MLGGDAAARRGRTSRSCIGAGRNAGRVAVPDSKNPLSGIYALLVEDDPDGCDLMQMMLRRFGAEVTAVSTAAAALESVRNRRPDVLVSDIGLPDGDGFALLKRVRESNHDLPAVAVTAYASRQDVAKALAAGFQAHVAKPVEPAQLSAAVAHASGR
jgi:CheY-like chemotaxis protein